MYYEPENPNGGDLKAFKRTPYSCIWSLSVITSSENDSQYLLVE